MEQSLKSKVKAFYSTMETWKAEILGVKTINLRGLLELCKIE